MMIRVAIPLISVLLASPPAAATGQDDASECVRVVASDGALPAVLEFGNWGSDATSVRIVGLASFSEDAVWDVIGGEPRSRVGRREAIALVARLLQTGLFASVEPRKDGDALDLIVSEFPSVRAVQVRGLTEFRSDDVLDMLFDTPSERLAERSARDLRDALPRECPAPVPPPAWLARVSDGDVRPGILWHGVDAALATLRRDLRSRGYGMARVEGRLTSDGELLLDVDEGHIGAVELRGVDPAIARAVKRELGLRRGDIFSSGELYSALERVEKRWPFLRAEHRAWDLEGDTLVVHFRTRRSEGKGDWTELFRHTPVTGFAPGFAGTLTIYDPGDRVHLLLDGALNVNTRRPNLQAATDDYFDRLNAHQRVDWLAGPRLRIPALGIAELGAQAHTLTATEDGWRLPSWDSYFYSALLNRADREYFRKSGVAAYVTMHWFEMLTLGAEYRRDRYAQLDVPGGVWSVFNRGAPIYGAMQVDEGEMGSAVFRLEYRSERESIHHVGAASRDAQTSLVEGGPPPVGLRTLATLEVADPSLGGIFKFTKFVSDTTVRLDTSRTGTLTLRLRAAGGHDLPLQKQEGLGGWDALRGYDFKEFRGTASILGTLQLEGRHLGAFVEAGSVRQEGLWLDPKPSAGAMLKLDDDGHTRAEAAWRLDGKGTLAPDFRILFAVPL